MAQRTNAAESIESSPARREDRPIDLVHLAKQCLGDEGLEQEVLRLFDTTVKTYMGRLQLAASFDELSITLHSLKGASSGVGAFGISELVKLAEVDIKAGRPINPERIADIGMAVEEVRGFIGEMLKNGAV